MSKGATSKGPGGAGRGLNREQIVRAAFVVLEETGLDGLNMRRLAAELDVKAPALYWHVKGKADLLDEMATSLWHEVLAATGEQLELGLADGLRGVSRGLRSTLLAHRDGAAVFGGTFVTDPEILRAQEKPLLRLTEQGWGLADVVEIWQIVYHFTVGWTNEEQAVRQAQAVDDRYDLDRRDERVDASRNPLVAEVGHLVFADLDARFESALGRLVGALVPA